MAAGAVYTKNGYNALFNRGYKSSPDNTVPSRFKIGTGTTTPVETDTDLETPIEGWNAASDFKDFVAGHPTFDTGNQKVTVQGFIGASQANGNSITEYGDFNTDGTPVCSSHLVFTAITKVSTIQVFITTTYKRGA